jgi:hypothetical protein
MSTLLEMRSRIADDLDRTDLSTQIDKAINRAITFYLKENFWFKETSSSFSLVVNQEEYIKGSGGVPSDIGAIDIMELQYSGNKYVLVEITPFELEARQTLDAVGTPDQFAQYQDRIKFYPIPNQASMTCLIKYTKSYSTLVNDSDTNDWLVYCEDLIEARARGWINRRILKDYEAANADKQEENDALSGIRKVNQQKTGNGRVIVTQF